MWQTHAKVVKVDDVKIEARHDKENNEFDIYMTVDDSVSRVSISESAALDLAEFFRCSVWGD